MNPTDKGNQKAGQMAEGGKERSDGRTRAFVRCFKCKEFGHCISECKSTTRNYFKCGNPGHRVIECRSNILTCYNCGEQGHISIQC